VIGFSKRIGILDAQIPLDLVQCVPFSTMEIEQRSICVEQNPSVASHASPLPDPF
jgi:hypothetical protein